MNVYKLNIRALIFMLLTACGEFNVKEVIFYEEGLADSVANRNNMQIIGKQIHEHAAKLNDVIKAIIPPNQINEMIKTQDGVEVIFSTQQKAQLVNNPDTIKYMKVYIPLSGNFTRHGVVMFFGDSAGYGALPPYIAKASMSEIKESINHIKGTE